MNKAELINAVAASADVSKKDTEAVISAMLDTITEALKEGDKVQLVGFGSFEVKKRAARIGRNPRTKEEIEIPATACVQGRQTSEGYRCKIKRGLRPPFTLRQAKPGSAIPPALLRDWGRPEDSSVYRGGF